MKVLFLGAGASKSAGYPLASDLLPGVGRACESSPFEVARQAWEEFDSWRTSHDGVLGRLLRNPNPEVVLSVLDLMAEALQAESVDLWHAMKGGELSPEEARKELRHPLVKELESGRRAIFRFLRCLDLFFKLRHWSDWRDENRLVRDYLREKLRQLEAGDVVITTNWDCIVERTLAEEGLWTPADGYGFPASTAVDHVMDPRAKIVAASKIPVLKLHGSYGWRRDHLGDDSPIILSYSNYLQQLPIGQIGHRVILRDDREPSVALPPEDSVLAYPSFLKTFHGPDLQRIWYGASEAIRRASEVEIVGFSLPRADSAVHALLGPLRFRLEEGSATVAVQDPSPPVLTNWESFLGLRIVKIKEPFGSS